MIAKDFPKKKKIHKGYGQEARAPSKTGKQVKNMAPEVKTVETEKN